MKWVLEWCKLTPILHKMDEDGFYSHKFGVCGNTFSIPIHIFGINNVQVDGKHSWSGFTCLLVWKRCKGSVLWQEESWQPKSLTSRVPTSLRLARWERRGNGSSGAKNFSYRDSDMVLDIYLQKKHKTVKVLQYGFKVQKTNAIIDGTVISPYVLNQTNVHSS